MGLSQTNKEGGKTSAFAKVFEGITLKKIILAVIGIIFVGVGIAFNADSKLGNDPIGILYDGARVAAHLSGSQLGMASNIVNIALLVIVFFIGRHYVNIGSFIYILPYGLAVNIGNYLHGMFFPNHLTLPLQILTAVIGCTCLYIGVGMYIAADIGMDPFTGFVMVLTDKFHKEYRVIKIGFDVCCTVLGFVLGGKLGVITVVCALIAGPFIQMFSKIFKKLV
jgi:uncharacterized membrane protein YczE